MFISLKNICHAGLSNPVNWKLGKGETWTILGRNGTGKSVLSGIVSGQITPSEGEIIYHCLDQGPFSEKTKNKNLQADIKMVSFNAAYTLADYNEMYYQQRFNNPDLDEIPRVADFFHGPGIDKNILQRVMLILEIGKLMDRFLIQLSSGELRKVLIAKILLDKPKMLVFDNPFIGLDIDSRKYLEDIFTDLKSEGIQLMFIVPSGNKIPECTTHVLKLDKREGPQIFSYEKFRSGSDKILNTIPDFAIDRNIFLSGKKPAFQNVISMSNITIKYKENVVCRGFNWNVNRGDKWALLGPNGSGKSTLLSFVYADNPKSYVKGVSLFGKERGSGESIWDIKSHIGFTSSEMHLYYRKKATCLQVMESGLFDSVGLYHACYGEEKHFAEKLMRVLMIEELKNRYFLEVSSGEQRLVLFARAIIKNPDVLILDEPFHGLDQFNKQLCKAVIDEYCRQEDKTLIFVTHRNEDIPACVTLFKELS